MGHAAVVLKFELILPGRAVRVLVEDVAAAVVVTDTVVVVVVVATVVVEIAIRTVAADVMMTVTETVTTAEDDLGPEARHASEDLVHHTSLLYASWSACIWPLCFVQCNSAMRAHASISAIFVVCTRALPTSVALFCILFVCVGVYLFFHPW